MRNMFARAAGAVIAGALQFAPAAMAAPAGGIVDDPCAVELAAAAGPPGETAQARTQREQRARDWPDLCHYRKANAALAGQATKVVFLGDSITEFWVANAPGLFTQGTVGRGISGQTSPQLLLRLYSDVVALHPRVMHLMVGTNDIAGNTGPATLQDVKNNLLAMLDLAAAHRITVVLAAIPPSKNLYWIAFDPRPRIRELNDWLRALASARKLVFVDYGAVLADEEGGMRAELSADGVHPSRQGYDRMRPLAEAAIARALARADAGGQ